MPPLLPAQTRSIRPVMKSSGDAASRLDMAVNSHFCNLRGAGASLIFGGSKL